MILTKEQIAFNRERLARKHSLHPDMVVAILDSHEELRRQVEGLTSRVSEAWADGVSVPDSSIHLPMDWPAIVPTD